MKPAVLALIATLGMTGCGDSSKRVNAAPANSVRSEMTKLNSESNRRVQSASAECMVESGFEYRVVPTTKRAPVVTVRYPASKVELEELRQLGYGHGQNILLAMKFEDPNLVAFGRLTPGEQAKWNAELGTCLRKSTESAPKNVVAFFDRLSAFDKQFQANPIVKKATSSWSSCMRGAGYEVSRRYDLNRVLDEVLAGIEVSNPPTAEGAELFLQAELNVSTADVSCFEETSLPLLELRRTEESRFLNS